MARGRDGEGRGCLTGSQQYPLGKEERSREQQNLKHTEVIMAVYHMGLDWGVYNLKPPNQSDLK